MAEKKANKSELTGKELYEKKLQTELVLLINKVTELNKSIDPDLRKKIEEQEKKIIANINGEDVIENIGTFLIGEGLEGLIERLFKVSSIAAAALMAPFDPTKMGDATMTHYKNVEKVAEIKKIETRITDIITYLTYSNPPKIGDSLLNKAKTERAIRTYQSTHQCTF